MPPSPSARKIALHRRLAAEATGFAALLDDTRTELVLSLMADAKRPLLASAEIPSAANQCAWSLNSKASSTSSA